jgi:glycerol-3-phosphate dehydrogenase
VSSFLPHYVLKKVSGFLAPPQISNQKLKSRDSVSKPFTWIAEAVAVNTDSIENVEFCQTLRERFIQKLRSTVWDVIVIGGGVTGAGVALEAVSRGLSVAVLDDRDFASGTSSLSSKLAHGGIRYIAHFELGLVREATTERNWLRDQALPHLTRPQQFIIPSFRSGRVGSRDLPESKDGLGKMRFATFLYDLLCGFKNYGRRQIIKDIEKIREMEPALEATRLKGVALYYDCNIDDARLVIETLKEAILKGDAIALNYVRVVGLTHSPSGRVTGVQARDMASREKDVISVNGKVVINSTGVWADDILSMDQPQQSKVIRPTKGVHITVHRSDLPVNRAFGLRSIDDGRFFFVLPRNDWVVIGTTDTDFTGNPRECFCDREDADYLRNTVSALFPSAQIGDEKILGTYAGLRPLVAEPGKSESDVSRKHVVLERDDGLFSLLGGKLTTFRKMAEDLFIKHLCKVGQQLGLPKFSCRKNLTKFAYTVATTKEEWQKEPEVSSSDLHPRILQHLYEQYGRGGLAILRQVQKDPELGSRLLDVPAYPVNVCPWILGEVDYVVRCEAPLHLEDVLCRRMEISWLVRPDYQGHIAVKTASRMGLILGWSKTRVREEVRAYLRVIKNNSFFFRGKIPVPDF